MSSIGDEVEKSFADACIGSRREEVLQLLHLPDENGHIAIDMLTNILLTGSTAEVDKYLKKVFKRLPEGLKLKLAKVAVEMAQLHAVDAGSSTLAMGLKSFKQLSWSNQVKSSLSRWEQGHLTLVDLFHDLSRFLFEGFIEPPSYQALVNQLLVFGGHLHNGSKNTYKKLPLRSIHEIRQIRLSSCLTRIYVDCRDGSLDILDARTADFLKSHPADGYLPTNSDPLVRWRLDANLREIMTFSQGVSGGRLDIGRTVRHGKALIEVESVASVDAKVVADWRVLVCVLKGRWLHPGEPKEGEWVVFGEAAAGAYSDGASDICRHDEGGSNHSPNDSSYEIDQRFFPSHDYPCQYFVVFACAWGGLVKVDAVVDLAWGVDIDQELTGVSLPTSHACFLYGSHGLLVYLSKEKGEWSSPYRLVCDDFMYDDILPTQPTQHNPGYSYLTHSHSSRGDIVRIAYEEVKCGKGHLASADSLGVVCVWKLGNLPQPTPLAGLRPFYEPAWCPLPVARHHLRHDGNITLLQFGGQGAEILYVSTNDRLLLLTWGTEGAGDVQAMRELALLDLAPHSWPPTLYMLFSVDSFLRVWRLRECEVSDGELQGEGAVLLTSWHHSDTTPWRGASMADARGFRKPVQSDYISTQDEGSDIENKPSSLTFLSLPQDAKPPKVVMVLPPMRMKLPSFLPPSSLSSHLTSFPPARPLSSYSLFVAYMDKIFNSPLSPLFRLARPLLSL
eukprot:gene37272-45254_t